MTDADRFRVLSRYGMAIGPFLVALGVRWLLGPILEDRAPYLLFALAVVAASIYGGRFPALVSTLLGAGAGIYFIASSPEGLSLFEASRLLQLGLYFAVCTGIGYLIHALCRARAQVEAFAQEQVRLAEALGAANAAKDHLLAAVSHDLRTPLNAVIGWANLLRRGALDETQAAGALETIEKNALAQERLISDLLDHSRIAGGKLRLKLRPVEPWFLLEEVVESLRPAALAKRIHLRLSGDRAGLIRADPDRVRQILWNLVSNALRFTPTGGHITLTLEATVADVTVRVQDDGPGVPPELLPHVFERYRQSPDAKGGLGLGLAIARQLAEMHGGAIHAGNAEPEGGARFDVVLPRHVACQAAHTTEKELTRGLDPAHSKQG
jgi:signal transduction histidine kinase